MSIKRRINGCVAAFVAPLMLASSMTPATALNLPSTALGQSVTASAPIEKVWCRWGCGPGPLVGGFVAGAVVGAVVASAARPAYAPVYDPVYAGPCWRRWIGPYGGVHWQRVC